MTTAEAHAADAAGDPPRARGPAPMLAIAAAVLLAAFFPTVRGLFETWLSSSSFHHGLLVAPIALWLCLRLGPPQEAARTWPPAIMGVLGGLTLWLVGRAANVNLIEQLAFVSVLIASVALLLGPAYSRRWAFPLAFLYFMVPFGGGFAPFLQDVAAGGVIALLKASGVAASLDGVMIATVGGRFEIAEACAGLNFLIAAAMIAALFAHLAFSHARKVVVFVVFAAGFALAANILRAYLVILAATLSEGRIAIGSDHFLFGWVFYGALLFVLIMIGRRFADPVRKPVERGSWAAPEDRREHALRRMPAAVAVSLAFVLCGAAYGRFVIDRGAGAEAPSFLPLFSAPGWRALPPAEVWRAPLGHADRVVQALYQSGSLSVQLNAAYFTHDREGAEIAGYDTRSYDGHEWRRISRRREPFLAFGAMRALDVDTIENETGARLDTITLYWLEDAILADPAALKIRQARARLVGKQKRGGAIVIAASSLPPEGGIKAISVFLRDVEPLDLWLARIDARRID